MRIHIMGICGTFMAGIAQIAKSLGHHVSGSDQAIYPPMSDILAQCDIQCDLGYDPKCLSPRPDLVLVGNAISRGNPMLEHILMQRIPYCSAPAWLYEHVLRHKHVLAVAGTHGKTTTTSILTWILEYAGKNPGFLIGGVAENFASSARYTNTDYFVIEADEYDTAFSDKRSKFVHYHPQTLIINNIEFDHADIFQNIEAIQQQFHHLIRVLPQNSHIIYNRELEVEQVLAMGCWSETVCFGKEQATWSIERMSHNYQGFKIIAHGKTVGTVDWSLFGEHNAYNALAAVIAAQHVGISINTACSALDHFSPVKRRLECIFEHHGCYIYDDFAHHPTAIKATLHALRQHVGSARIISILELGSNTMKMAIHAQYLADALSESDEIMIYQSANLDWEVGDYVKPLAHKCRILKDIDDIVAQVVTMKPSLQYILIMSNSGFGNIQTKLITALKQA